MERQMILGIDLGQKNTGLAISEGTIATPYRTIRHQNLDQAASIVMRTIEQENVSTVVLGFVEGQIKTLFEDFATKLKNQKPDLKIVMWDETLTTGQARETLIKLQVPKTKRARKEHEYAASFILQSYLDS